jgi:acetylornithine deacetylase/succinyl-diaminopimelate desuccinylase-like protein
MTATVDELREHVAAHFPAHVDLLCDLVRRPSRTGHLDEVGPFADRLVEVLREAGAADAEAVRVDDGAPVVFAEWPGPPGAPTVTLYSHYDVIAIEPLDAWTYPPFGATRVDGRIYGRGTTDAKGNLLSLIAAVKTFLAVRGELPCGVRLVGDGEEEAGSNNLPRFVDAYADRIAADAVLSFDGGIDPSGVPKIGLGTSGMLYVELRCAGARHELHSARSRLFANPAWRIAWALACLKDADERILIDGFADDVRPPTDRDRALMAAMAWNDDVWLRDAGVERFLTGVSGPDAVERLLFQPSLAICGLAAGFIGDGPKAVIPATATAKLEFRIVPDQTPQTVLAQLRAHLDRNGFADVEVVTLAAVETAKTDPDSAIVTATVQAAQALYGGCVLKPTEEYAGRQGAWLGQRLGVPGVQTGIGPVGFRGHAADEFVTEEHFALGIRYALDILDRFVKEHRAR